MVCGARLANTFMTRARARLSSLSFLSLDSDSIWNSTTHCRQEHNFLNIYDMITGGGGINISSGWAIN